MTDLVDEGAAVRNRKLRTIRERRASGEVRSAPIPTVPIDDSTRGDEHGHAR